MHSEFICDFQQCKKYLRDPISLPCGETICKLHIDDTSTSFKCPVCDEDHIKPQVNMKMNSVLNKNLHLTGQHKQVKESFDKLEKEINDFQKSNLAHPQLYIHDFFSEIRNKIDLHRDQMIENIQQRSEKLLNRLKLIEQECYRNEAKLEKIDYEAKKVELNELSEKLRLSNLKVGELFEMKASINSKIQEFKKIYSKEFEQNLLMNKTISFVEEDSTEFGHLIVNHKFDQFEITKESSKLLKIFQGHTSCVYCIEQIEDFSKIISCSSDNYIKIWSTESGECLKTLTGHTQCVESLIISNDRKHIISGSHDKTIKVWDIEKNFEYVQTLQQEYYVWSLCLLPNNIQNDFECVQTLQQEDGVMSLCLLPNNILVCGLSNGTITKWNLNNFTKIDSFKAHESHIWDLKHVSSFQIVSCSQDKKINLWNFETNEYLRTFVGHTKGIRRLEVSFDKSKLYSGSADKSLRVWDISSGQCLKTIDLGSEIYCLKLLSSRFIAVGLYEAKENLKIIDLNSSKILKSLETQSATVRSLSFNPNKNELFVGSNNGPIRAFQF
jgi:WD40 repeat protein